MKQILQRTLCSTQVRCLDKVAIIMDSAQIELFTLTADPISRSSSVSLANRLLLKRLEQLLQLRICVIRVLDRVSNRPLVAVDLVVVTALVRLITKEVDSLVVDAVLPLLLLCNEVQAVCLVPAGREYVEGDLPADRVCEAIVGEGLLQRAYHGRADVVFDVVCLVLVSLLGRSVTADRRDIDHAVAELDECTALDGDVEVGNVV